MFTVKTEKPKRSTLEDSLKRQIESIFQSLLRVVVPEDSEGRPILSGKVYIDLEAKDYYSSRDSHQVEYTPLADVRFSEPRILMISKEMQSILKYMSIYREDGSIAQICGFRLIPLAWVMPYSSSLTDNIGSLSSRCTCHCRFCYIDGNPLISSRSFNMALGEARLRSKYYDPEKKRALFPILREYLEPMANPHLLEIFQTLRRDHPNEYLTMITNGSSLTEEVIQKLGELKPINVNISLNTINPNLRTYMMRDKNPEIVLRSFDYLKREGIPFGGSIVAYDSMPLDELEETIRFLDEKESEGIRVVLPGFTQFHSPQVHFSTHQWWPKVVEVIERLRRELINYIMLQPNAYWIKSTAPIVDGVLKNSPAHRAGIRPLDRILTINGHGVESKAQARKVLFENRMEGREVLVEVEQLRGVKSFTLNDNLSIEEDFYPYKPVGYLTSVGKNYGIALVGSLHKKYLLYLAGIIRKHRAEHVIVFIGQLMRPQLIEELSKIDEEQYFGDCQIDFEVIEPLFWGGNIVLGDLTMVSDYLHQLDRLKKRGIEPDLVVIPSSFLVDWGRDYAGEVYLEIERKTGIKVELLPCETIIQ